MSVKKDLKEVFREAERQGWKVTQTPGGHWKLVPPDPSKDIVHTGKTPSDHKALANVIAQMRRSGFRWPAKGGR
ncbi:MAG: hypothetical protein WD556_11455 [Actinomycetota bacterium]